MFEQLRLIVRNCEFRPSPDKFEARKEFFRGFLRKKRITGVAFLWLPFFGEAKKVTRR
jgi:hypothetical protein